MWFPYRSQTYHIIFYLEAVVSTWPMFWSPCNMLHLFRLQKRSGNQLWRRPRTAGGVLLVASFCWENGWILIFEKLSSVIADHGAIFGWRKRFNGQQKRWNFNYIQLYGVSIVRTPIWGQASEITLVTGRICSLLVRVVWQPDLRQLVGF